MSQLTKEVVLNELQAEDFAQPDIGVVDALSTLSNPDHCFGRNYTPDSVCNTDCNAVAMFRGEEVRISELCRQICSGGLVISDTASKYYRYGCGSYYVMKALISLREGTLEQVAAEADRLARVDGKEFDEMADRTYRTLSDQKGKNVRKSGRGKEAIYGLEH